MISNVVSQLVRREGLEPLLALREQGVVPRASDVADLLIRSDILALGAAADLARRRECGDAVQIHVPFAPRAADATLVIGHGTTERGTALLRRIASQRLVGPIGVRIVVDFGALGLEIAQVALSFGATDLAGPIGSRRGLPLIDGDDAKKLVKRREIAGYVERAGFRPVFVSSEGPPAPARASARDHVDS